MQRYKRKITKEMFDRAENGYLAQKDYEKVFDESERYGYGVYADHAYEENGEYYVAFDMGDSCD